MIIGEAPTRLSRDLPEVADRIPDLPQAIGLRNYLAHQYDDIDPTTVWDTLVQDLPVLRRTVESLICERDSATKPSAETEERKDDDRQPCEPAPFDRTGGTADTSHKRLALLLRSEITVPPGKPRPPLAAG